MSNLLLRSASNSSSVGVMVPPGNSVHGEKMRPPSARWLCSVFFSSEKHVNDGDDVTNKISSLSLLCFFLSRKKKTIKVPVWWLDDRQVAPLFPLFSDGRRDGSYWRSSCSKTTSPVCVTSAPAKCLLPRHLQQNLPSNSPPLLWRHLRVSLCVAASGRFYLNCLELSCLAGFFFLCFFPWILRPVSVCVCVWTGTLGLLPHYSLLKEMHTLATQHRPL